ncbi:uncharacterized protein MICPUCDRAFT_59255 [Micromonas pusilla CCMP1545]|uniref:Predicted protein n=1 Tax=Micromonas pusilla (strain CCMP1545) TaxID=564608 RepID=C1MWU3_MICPC|nr:uncharacterized protein MICPUCDRAFT_59255 [Micromonas pusilla CCMP1545]EEH55935.1 predicted protein [Micromonas pusilla CCMP1545]|eukprot:XP_003059983.1 predicted protein [Micromonas pusilla CCMP1545]
MASRYFTPRVWTRECNQLISLAGDALLDARPKQVALSGPAGFLGSRVLAALLDAHHHRRENGLEPGEVVLLSSSPGNLMSRLINIHGYERMNSVRATRVDYYFQHDVDSWRDQLGSLGMGGPDAVFVNLAALAGPRSDRPDAMMAVNYRAPVAAARACEELRFGHWIQSSTQAVKAERAGQVPYSRWKAMADYSLARLEKLPVSVFTLGLLYCKAQGVVGQRGDTLNMVDLTLLPITPIMGNGRAPLQPLEVGDAAARVAFCALTEPTERPVQPHHENPNCANWSRPKIDPARQYTWRAYDAVGPETMTMLKLMETFAALNGRKLNPVFVDYRNFETVLNVASLGNLNRQFVSLLRSEQDAERPIVGNPDVFETLMGKDAKLFRMDDALKQTDGDGNVIAIKRRSFPFLAMTSWTWNNLGVIIPGTNLVLETIGTYLFGRRFAIDESWRWIRFGAMSTLLGGITAASMHAGAEFSKWWGEVTGGAGWPPWGGF